jgi:hypothetical protein
VGYWYAVDVDEVVDEEGTRWPVDYDDRGRVFLDVDDDVEVVIDGAIVDGEVYEAYVDRRGRLQIVFDD